jgi:hypothetical protein
MTRAEVAAQSLIDAGYIDPTKYDELVSVMAYFFGDIACEAKESEREECAKVADQGATMWLAFGNEAAAQQHFDLAHNIRARGTK